METNRLSDIPVGIKGLDTVAEFGGFNACMERLQPLWPANLPRHPLSRLSQIKLNATLLLVGRAYIGASPYGTLDSVRGFADLRRAVHSATTQRCFLLFLLSFFFFCRCGQCYREHKHGLRVSKKPFVCTPRTSQPRLFFCEPA